MAATRALLTTGVVYLRQLFAGLSSGTGTPGITLFSSTAAVATTAGDLTTLISYTLPANALARDGDRVEIEASTTQAADTDNKLSLLAFGGTTVASRSGVADNNLPRKHRATIIRTGAATQVAAGEVETQGQGTLVTNTTPAETLSGDVVITLKAQNQTDTTSPSVTSRYMTVTFFPAP